MFNRDNKEITRQISTKNGQLLKKYRNNHVKTSIYSWYTFLPLFLYKSFRLPSNLYFLFIAILQLIPAISSLSPITTLIPLGVVLFISAIREFYDDYLRHANDRIVNERDCSVIVHNSVKTKKWGKINVGDLVLVRDNEPVPADVLIITTPDGGLCSIETSDLDGETNLKSYYAPEVLFNYVESCDDFDQVDYDITCDPPNADLENFHGTMSFDHQKMGLIKQNLILRGSVIRNTEFVIGLVIYAGHDTKTVKNSGKLKIKQTNVVRKINSHMIFIFAFMFVIIFLLLIAKGTWEKLVGQNLRGYSPRLVYRNDNEDIEILVVTLLSFFSILILMNAIIPISLIISVEIIHFFNSLFINWDENISGPGIESSRSRSTELVEELGQITHVFTDKTGTLTQNVMRLLRISVGGEIVELNEKIQRHETKDMILFFKSLAICNTVFVGTNKETGEQNFQAQSPDEKALVECASRFNVVLKSRDVNCLTVDFLGQLIEFKILAILDFDSHRKRMSIIARQNRDIILFCKGSDSAIFDIIMNPTSETRQLTETHIIEFAKSGLRTLCFAYKVITEQEWVKWKTKFDSALSSGDSREKQVQDCYREIEQNLTLLGAAGIEDKLQEDVPETIAKILSADIQIWMLTGDKLETAINIAYSCFLIKGRDIIQIISDNSAEMVETQLKNFKTVIDERLVYEDITPKEYLTKRRKGRYKRVWIDFCLVITGDVLTVIMRDYRELFTEIMDFCACIVCSRLTPYQKSMVVEFVNAQKKGVSLAVGDGGNDVSMIKAAHVGVGIYGLEGRQAVFNADYSIAQFSFLNRLMFFHGRLSYTRIAKFIKYFIYKSFAFTFLQGFFQFFSGYSSVNIYNQIFVALYNLLYTSFPVTVMGIIDKDVKEKYLDHHELYYFGQKNILYNNYIFALSMVEGILTSFIIIITNFLAFNNTISTQGNPNDDLELIRHSIMTILVLILNLRCAIAYMSWTIVHAFAIAVSVTIYFILTIVFNDPVTNSQSIGAAYVLYMNPSFWLLFFLNAAIILIPILVIKVIMNNYKPNYSKIPKQMVVDKTIFNNGFAFSSNMSYVNQYSKVMNSRIRKPSKIIRNIINTL